MSGRDPAVRLRRARPEDLEAVAAIERAAFPVPWSRALFEKELEHDWSTLLVAESGGEVAGFIVFWIIQDEVHLLDMAVHPGHRQAGLGRRLLRGCLEAGRTAGARIVTLEVRPSNDAARHLYGAHGFQTVGVRKRYYEDPPAPGHTSPRREDALIMELTL